MGKQKATRKYAVAKKIISLKDSRLKSNKEKEEKLTKKKEEEEAPRHIDQTPSALWFKYNTALGPPYHVLVDTNFINFSIKNKLEMFRSMMDCLYAKCTPCVTDCVMAELEKLGSKYRVALRLAKVSQLYRKYEMISRK